MPHCCGQPLGPTGDDVSAGDQALDAQARGGPEVGAPWVAAVPPALC